MLGAFASNLVASWRLWLIAGAVAAFLGLAAVANGRATEIRALQAEKAKLSSELASASDLLQQQNTAVAALKEASDTQARAARKAQEAAQRALGAANARAEALAHAAVPSACPDALEWLRDQVSTAERTREAQ